MRECVRVAGCVQDQSVLIPRRCSARRRAGCLTARAARWSASTMPGSIDGATHEAVAPSALAVVVDDGVVQPADVGGDRNGAVGHGLHLGQAARLESARHQEEVGPGEDAMTERVVVALDERDAVGCEVRVLPRLARPTPCRPAPSRTSRAGTSAKKRRASSARSTPFCVGEAGDHAHDRAAVVGPTELVEQRGPARTLSRRAPAAL